MSARICGLAVAPDGATNRDAGGETGRNPGPIHRCEHGALLREPWRRTPSRTGALSGLKNAGRRSCRSKVANGKRGGVHLGANFHDNPILRAESQPFWRKLGIRLHLAKPHSD
jgi:hypothetical protein